MKHQLPGAVDLEVEGIVDRINGLPAGGFSRMLDETLADFGLTDGEWKALGHLQLCGAAASASPSGSWPSEPSSRAER